MTATTTTNAGWYTDSTNEHISRYWTGAAWTDEREWNGQSWIDRPAPAEQAATPLAATPLAATPLAAMPQPATAQALPAELLARVRASRTLTVVVGGAIGVAVSAFMPWVAADGISGGPTGGAPALLVALAVAAVWFALPSPNGAHSVLRRIGLIAVVGFLAFAVVTNWAQLQQLQSQDDGVQAGSGLLIYSGAVVALVVGTIRTLLGKTS